MTTSNQSKRSLPARIISLEGAMGAFGLYSLGTGLYYGEILWTFWGVMILTGLTLLVLVRRRDWKKHWEAMDAEVAARSRPKADAARDSQPKE